MGRYRPKEVAGICGGRLRPDKPWILPFRTGLIHSVEQKMCLTNMGLCTEITRLTQSGRIEHETHLPTFRRPSQAHPWLLGSHEDSWRSRGDPRPPCEGPSPPRSLRW